MASPVVPPPPPGFELDAAPQGVPPPPPGFELDAQAGPPPDNSLGAGVVAAGEGSGISPMLQGIKNTFTHPGDALRSLGPVLKDPIGYAVDSVVEPMKGLARKSRDKFNAGDYSGAAATGVSALIPGFGEQANQAGEELRRGEYAKGAGRTAGIGASLLAPKAIEAAKPAIVKGMRATAKAGIRTGLKPGGNNFERIDAAMDAAVNEAGLGNEFLPTTKGIKRFDATVQEVGGQIGKIVDNAPPVETIKTQRVWQAVEESKKNLLQSERAAVDAAAEDAWNELRQPDGSLRDMTPAEAHSLKVRMQNAVVKAKKGAYAGGAHNGPGIEGWQTVAGNIGEQLVEQFPELKGANARYAGLKALEPVLDAARNRILKREPFGLIAGAVGGAVGGAMRSIEGGVAATAVTRILTDPILRTKAAFALSRASGGVVSRVSAAARLQSYANAVKQGTAEVSSMNAPQQFPKAAEKQNDQERMSAIGHIASVNRAESSSNEPRKPRTAAQYLARFGPIPE